MVVVRVFCGGGLQSSSRKKGAYLLFIFWSRFVGQLVACSALVDGVGLLTLHIKRAVVICAEK